MQTLTQIKSLLDSYGLHPKHRYGQNFLHDANQMARILAAADLAPGDLVLEVGPGTGALTQWILEAGARLVAVEVDADFEPLLRAQFAEPFGPRFALVIGDALAGKHHLNPSVLAALRDMANPPASPESPATQVPVSDAPPSPAPMSPPTPQQIPNPKSQIPNSSSAPPFKMIANLPYNVASPLLANLVVDHPAMSRAVVMVQREVAGRLTAEPGNKDYGPLGVMLQAICEVHRVATLAPTCFWPRPQVESAVVSLRRRDHPLTNDAPALARLLQRLFTQRRKQIGTTLGRATALPPGIDASARPEQLSVEQLVELSRGQG